MYVRKSSQVTCIEEFSITTANYGEIILKNNRNIRCVLYRVPSADFSLFLGFGDQLFDSVRLYNYHLSMNGAFNITLSSEPSDRNPFLTLMNSNSLQNCINYPTRVTINPNAMTDLFLNNTERERVVGNTVLSDINDHFPTGCFVDICKNRLTDKESLPLFQCVTPYSLGA